MSAASSCARMASASTNVAHFTNVTNPALSEEPAFGKAGPFGASGPVGSAGRSFMNFLSPNRRRAAQTAVLCRAQAIASHETLRDHHNSLQFHGFHGGLI